MSYCRRTWCLLGVVALLTTLNFNAQLNRGVIEGIATGRAAYCQGWRF